MSSRINEKRGWNKIRRGIDKANQKEIDTINNPDTDPWVRECLKLGIGLTDLKGDQIKKIERKK